MRKSSATVSKSDPKGAKSNQKVNQKGAERSQNPAKGSQKGAKSASRWLQEPFSHCLDLFFFCRRDREKFSPAGLVEG